MKKCFFAAAFVLLITACSENTTHSTTPPSPTTSAIQNSSQATPTAAFEAIQMAESFTLSRNDLFPYRSSHEYLSVVLTKGKYFEDWSPGPFMGRNWVGEFQIQLSNENGEVVQAVELNGYFQEDLVFNSLFDIAFDDYNGDGNIDFTIGQYASSNGNVFKLFTLDPSGRIEHLPIEGHRELFITGGGRYSTKLAKNKTGFSTTYYDNSIGKNVTRSFAWNGKQFVSESNIDDPNRTAIEYDVSDLDLTLPKGWNLSIGDRFGASITDENGDNLGSVFTYAFADDFDFRSYKPNHSEMTNEETIDTPIGSGTLYTLDADNGTAASGITGTHDVYFAVIPIQDQIIYVLEFSKHDKEAATKMQFIDLLSSLRLKM